MNEIPVYPMLLLCLTLVAGCGKGSETVVEGKASPTSSAPAREPGLVVLGSDAPELRQIKVEAVRGVPVAADEVIAPAKIEAAPNRVSHAVIPIPGRIARVLVKLGDAVVRGQPLVAVESAAIAEAQSVYIQAEASVHQSEAAESKAETDLARLRDLYDHEAVARKDVLAAQTAAALSKAALEQAQSAREQARRRLDLLGLHPGPVNQQITIAAPVSGKVLEIGVVEGEFRNELNTSLLTIADLSVIWATSDVPESKIRYCRLGGLAELELIAYPHETFRARVTRIADTVEPETRTVKVSAEIHNGAGRLRPEMFGQLRYTGEMVHAAWVKPSAVIRIADKDFVFVEQAPGSFLSTPVALGKAHGGGYTIVAGIRPGDRVVTQGAIYLKAAL